MPLTLEMLPTLNACLNTLATLCLLAGYWAIRRGHPKVHRALMVSALAASTAFLTSYLIYHAQAERTVFREPAWFRPIYLVILLTHTVLAVVIVPLVLTTLWRAWKEQWDAHRRLARWTLPLWLYVSVTGVLIYYLLYVKYPQTRPVPPPRGATLQSSPGPYRARCMPPAEAVSMGRPSNTSRTSFNRAAVA
ncbi:DUF420 domain-containing protein [Fontisphaera persica]|uniref:DUF420 domain-containing protein n=1 Tax=Fontisphaera persica TaxID=2974023 RepID=UPI0024BFE30A|nr:DUF420 domain-containing protein [Fontisphaera persica]WCJ61246.1 DUF420 domain-containing protein [Fontisphaera persica]